MVPLLPIADVAAAAGIPAGFIEPYGRHCAKVRLEYLETKPNREPGKMILVTAITPTSHGEGKTVTAVGLVQALRKLGHNAIGTLRQPSLGPVFGVKGGANGGGKSQLHPAELINLHFTGDFHAITAAHNLLAAMADSHAFHGNSPAFDPARITWPRTMDMNDRALRRIVCGVGGKANGIERESGFVITAASEVMAVLALANSRADLRRRLENLVAGYGPDGSVITAGQIGAVGSMMVLLHNALLPNLVQSTEHAPSFVHAGPFGNIAHGTSSVISQKMALRCADFVVNECGFAADLGFEKYIDIVMGSSGIVPAAAVLVASVRALEAHGTPPDALASGLANLEHHMEILETFRVPYVVAVNRFPGDTDAEIAAVREFCRARGVACEESSVFDRGGEGGTAVAEQVASLARSSNACPKPVYAPETPLTAKIEAVAKRIYGAGDVVYSEEANRKLGQYSALGYGNLPVCMAKTQNSTTDDPKTPGAPKGWTLRITDASLSAGAGFVVAIAGNMMRMPGLGKTPRAYELDVDESGQIVGLV